MDSQWSYLALQSLYAVPTFLTVIALLYLVSRGLPERKESFSASKAFVAYCYSLIGLGVVAGVIGLTLFVRIGMMAAFDIDWTEDDLTLASVITGTGLIITLVHILAKSAAGERAREAMTAAKRLYLSWMTFGFGIAALVSIPLAIYAVVRYYREIITPDPPATQIAMAIVLVLIWVYYLMRLLREADRWE